MLNNTATISERDCAATDQISALEYMATLIEPNSVLATTRESLWCPDGPSFWSGYQASCDRLGVAWMGLVIVDGEVLNHSQHILPSKVAVFNAKN